MFNILAFNILQINKYRQRDKLGTKILHRKIRMPQNRACHIRESRPPDKQTEFLSRTCPAKPGRKATTVNKVIYTLILV